jgi:hypothetical protein
MEQTLETNAARLLNGVTGIIKRYEAQWQKTGEKYNLFKVADIAHKEVIMCRVLADLMNPQGRHCQGSRYLRLFWETIASKLPSHPLLDIEHTRVTTEYVIDENRRIDPRNGNTFYVGKGKDNRVFAHVSGVIKDIQKEDAGAGIHAKKEEDQEDETKLKIDIIRQIHAAKLEVLHIIHRHGMDEKTAYEVEAALIDAYAGLANEVGGHDSADRGPMNADEIVRNFNLPVIESFPDRCLMIKIRESYIAQRGSIYEVVRYCWKLGEKRKQAQYVLAVINGVVREIYKEPVWSYVEELDRWEFSRGKVSVERAVLDRYLDHQIPAKYRKPGMAAPCLYTW